MFCFFLFVNDCNKLGLMTPIASGKLRNKQKKNEIEGTNWVENIHDGGCEWFLQMWILNNILRIFRGGQILNAWLILLGVYQ